MSSGREESAKDVVAAVVLHATRSELGALLSGRFEPALRANDAQLAAQVSDCPFIYGACVCHCQKHSADGAEGAVLAHISSQCSHCGTLLHPKIEALHRRSWCTGILCAHKLVSFCTQVADTADGKGRLIDPEELSSELREIWKTYSKDIDGSALTQLRMLLVGKIAPTEVDKLLAAGRADFSQGVQVVPARLVHHRHAARENATPRCESAAASLAHQQQQQNMDHHWPAWMQKLPVPPTQLALRVLQLGGLKAMPPAIGRRAGEPVGAGEDGGSSPTGSGAHCGAGVREDPATSLERVAAVLCLDTLERWEYATALASVSHMLVEGFYDGGHIILSGADTHALEEVARLAAMSAGASVLSLGPPPGHKHPVCDRSDPGGHTDSRSQAPMSAPNSSGQQRVSGGAWSASYELAALLTQLVQEGAAGQAPDDTGFTPRRAAVAVEHATTADNTNGAGSEIGGGEDVATAAAAAAAAEQLPPPGSQRFVLIVNEGAAEDDGVLDLLQQLVHWPSAAPPLVTASASAVEGEGEAAGSVGSSRQVCWGCNFPLALSSMCQGCSDWGLTVAPYAPIPPPLWPVACLYAH